MTKQTRTGMLAMRKRKGEIDMDSQQGLKWWQVKDSDGYPLRQPPEWDRLDEEMAQKAAATAPGQGALK